MTQPTSTFEPLVLIDNNDGTATLSSDPELRLADEHNQQIKRAWGLTKKLLNADEIESFGELLRHYGA